MKLQELLKEICEEMGEEGSVYFRDDYSGRGMYGRKCIGITGPWQECQAVITEVIMKMSAHLVAVARESVDPNHSATDEDLADAERDFEVAIAQLMDNCMDDMGLSTIVYWSELEPIAEG